MQTLVCWSNIRPLGHSMTSFVILSMQRWYLVVLSGLATRGTGGVPVAVKPTHGSILHLTFLLKSQFPFAELKRVPGLHVSTSGVLSTHNVHLLQDS